MITNADITIYNYYIGSDRLPVYLETQIKGVNWYTKQEVDVDNGLKSADNYKIRIPVDAYTQRKEYIDPERFKALSLDEAKQYWTIDNGDYFVKGLHGPVQKESEIRQNNLCGKVVSWSDNRRGSLCMQHFRLGGVR